MGVIFDCFIPAIGGQFPVDVAGFDSGDLLVCGIKLERFPPALVADPRGIGGIFYFLSFAIVPFVSEDSALPVPLIVF